MTRDTPSPEPSPLVAGSAAGTAEESIAEASTFLRPHPSPLHNNYGSLPPSASTSPDPFKEPPPRRSGISTFIYDNRGLFLFGLAQLFGGLMGMFTRLLATSLPSGQKYHALQILFVRMSITWVCCYIWMWWNNVAHMPLGEKGIRSLLVIRGCSGFIGVCGLYYSLMYLPLPDATVITFLVPTVVSLICSLIPSLHEPFTTNEKIGGFVSLVGVTLIARPTFLFPPGTESNATLLTIPGVKPPYVSPHQRTIAVIGALIGVIGAASAYTTIRVIGKRAHPLISVTYFAAFTTLLSLIGILTIPSVGGMLFPKDLLEWSLLTAIGVSGFLLQFLLTKGLQLVKAGRATSLVYTQMIWAVVFEWLIWGNAISGLSFLGAVLILGGAAWVNLQKWRDTGKAEDEERGRSVSVGRINIDGEESERGHEHEHEREPLAPSDNRP